MVLIGSEGVLDRPLDVLVATSLAGRSEARVGTHDTLPISVPASNLLAPLIEGLVDARGRDILVENIRHIRVIRVIGLDLHHSDGVDHALGSARRAIQMRRELDNGTESTTAIVEGIKEFTRLQNHALDVVEITISQFWMVHHPLGERVSAE
jgi:hypothetical protein